MRKKEIHSNLKVLKSDARNISSWTDHVLEKRGLYDLAGEELKKNDYHKFDYKVRTDTVIREFVSTDGTKFRDERDWDEEATIDLRDHNNLQRSYQDKYMLDRKRLCMDLLSVLSAGYKEAVKNYDVERFQQADAKHDSLEMFRMIRAMGVRLRSEKRDQLNNMIKSLVAHKPPVTYSLLTKCEYIYRELNEIRKEKGEPTLVDMFQTSMLLDCVKDTDWFDAILTARPASWSEAKRWVVDRLGKVSGHHTAMLRIIYGESDRKALGKRKSNINSEVKCEPNIEVLSDVTEDPYLKKRLRIEDGSRTVRLEYQQNRKIPKEHCANCGRNNHATTECRRPRKHCALCKRTNHSTDACRDPKFSNGSFLTTPIQYQDPVLIDTMCASHPRTSCTLCGRANHTTATCRDPKYFSRNHSVPIQHQDAVPNDVKAGSQQPSCSSRSEKNPNLNFECSPMIMDGKRQDQSAHLNPIAHPVCCEYCGIFNHAIEECLAAEILLSEVSSSDDYESELESINPFQNRF